MRVSLAFLLLLTGSAICAHAAGTDWRQLLIEAQELRTHSPGAALDLLNQHLPTEATATDPQGLAALYELRGGLLRGAGDYALAAQDAERIKSLAITSGDLDLRTDGLLLIGKIHAESGHLPQALQSFHEARELLESGDNLAKLARALNAIGVAHNLAGDHVRAQRYFERAVTVLRSSDDQSRLAAALGNLALVVGLVDGPAAGVPIHQEVIELSEAAEDWRTAALARTNLCNQLVELNRLEEAEPLCLAAMHAVDPFGEARWQAGVRQNLAKVMRGRGEVDQALALLEESLELAEDLVPVVVEENLAALAEILLDLEQFERVAAVQGHLIELRENRRATEAQALIEELEVRYQVQQTEAELDLLRLEGELQVTQIRLRNLLVLAMGIVVILAMLAALGALRSSRAQSALKSDLAERNAALEHALGRITELARRDPLTGLVNRRALEEVAEQELARKKRENTPLTVVIADIDQFKPINDRYGHSIGDEVLAAIAQRLSDCFRESDLVARWGGEEFLCLLPDASAESAAAAIERFRTDQQSKPIRTGVGPLTVSLTFGVAEVDENLHEAVRRADAAMYRGKACGRDQLVLATRPDPDCD